MSADNYYLIRKHPTAAGKFVALYAFASDPHEPEVDLSRDYTLFDDPLAALLWAQAQPSEYGASIDPECGQLQALEERPVTDELTGGPYTRHGHAIPGVTVYGNRPPRNIARCGGPALCTECAADARRIQPTPAIPTAQVRALLRLLYPDHMTPTAHRQFTSACDSWEDQQS